MAQGKEFKIIIVGGGIAGLTLAAMLEKFGINYILLESYGDIAPEVGASIGLFPNGLRILDQLGCYEAIRTLPEGNVKYVITRDENGRVLSTSANFKYHMEQRLGYPTMFFDRQWLLRILYDHLAYKDRVKLNKKVIEIKLSNNVEVLTEDGDTFEGSIVVGADGIYSTVRTEMFRLANKIDPNYFDQEEFNKVPCYYKCSFGIAKDIPNWKYEDLYLVRSDGASQMLISGPDGRVYWFFFSQLPETKYGHDIPKYTKEDEVRFVQENAHKPITETINFSHVYERRISSTLTALHEMVLEKWFFRRIITLGDSAHKPNPIGGQGGNNAIESPASLVNALLEKRDSRGSLDGLSEDEIEDVFLQVLDVRHERAKMFVRQAHEMQSLFANEKPLVSKLLMRLQAAKGIDAYIDRLGSICRAGVRINKLPVPKRVRSVPFDDELPTKPLGSRANLLVQVLIVAAMLFLLASPGLTLPIPFARLAHSDWEGERLWYKGASSLTHPHNGLTMSYTLIWIVESYRAGNKGTLISLPIIPLLMAQVQGFFRMAPLYVMCAVFEGFDLPPGRFVRPAVAKAIVPALMLGYTLPAILTLLSTTNSKQQTLYAVWQPSPAVVALLVSVFSRAIGRWQRLSTRKENSYSNIVQEDKNKRTNSEQDTIDRIEDDKQVICQSFERYRNPDLPTLQVAYSVLFWVQAIINISTTVYDYLQPNVPTAQVFIGMKTPSTLDRSLSGPATTIRAWSQYDMFSCAALLSYELFAIWKLRQMGYIITSRAALAVMGIAAGHLTVGPGATLAALWSWREDVLANVAPVK